MTRQYQVEVFREDGWWMVAIPEISGLTQARRLSEAAAEARSYIATSTDTAPEDVEVVIIDIRVPAGDGRQAWHLIEETARARARQEQLEIAAADVLLDYVANLTGADIPVRDIGYLLQYSHQRISQLAAEAKHRSASSTPQTAPPAGDSDGSSWLLGTVLPRGGRGKYRLPPGVALINQGGLVVDPGDTETGSAKPVHASAVSRHLHSKYGIITVPDHTREGYRVSGRSDKSVAIYCQFNNDAKAQRRADELADALEAEGYVVRRLGEGIITIDGKLQPR